MLRTLLACTFIVFLFSCNKEESSPATNSIDTVYISSVDTVFLTTSDTVYIDNSNNGTQESAVFTIEQDKAKADFIISDIGGEDDRTANVTADIIINGKLVHTATYTNESEIYISSTSNEVAHFIINYESEYYENSTPNDVRNSESSVSFSLPNKYGVEIEYFEENRFFPLNN